MESAHMNLKQLAKQAVQSSSQAGSGGGLDAKSLATGALAGSLVGFLANSRGARNLQRRTQRTVRKHAGTAGLALISGIALKAYADHRSQSDQSANVLSEVSPSGGDQKALVILMAMIAAAASDGVIDEDERRRITGKLDEDNASAEVKALVLEEMANPSTAQDIAVLVSDEVFAAEVYAAAVLAIDIDEDSERAFLNELAGAMGLSPSMTSLIESEARHTE